MRGTLRQWGIREAAVVKHFGRVHKNSIVGLGASRDANVLVSADSGGDVMIWDIAGRAIDDFIHFEGMRVTTACLI